MTKASRSWAPCVMGLLSAGAVACATSNGAGPGDAGSSSSIPVKADTGVAVDTGNPVIIVGMDSGPPSMTVTNDGGTGDATVSPSPDAARPIVDGSTATDVSIILTPDTGVATIDAPAGMDDAGTAGDAGGSCGFSTGIAACDSCLTASCCTSEKACAENTTCATCVTSETPPNTCSTNTKANAFISCFSASCSAECGGSGDAGTPGADAGGGAVPTTCKEADRVAGCCSSDKKTNYYCSTATSTKVETKVCAAGKVCTWNGTSGYYACETGTSSHSDPSGTYPIACE